MNETAGTIEQSLSIKEAKDLGISYQSIQEIEGE